MKVLFLCGVFGPEIEKDLIRVAKRPIEYSANVFQEKMISGLKKYGADMEIVSAPFVGSFPNASGILRFDAEKYRNNNYQYVSFNNIWGLRNYSRARALKAKIKPFAIQKDEQKLIVVYSPHTPFLEAAVYAKRIDPSIKICLVVPDLPQYMNLRAKVSLAYKLGKKLDIARFEKLSKHVDSYMLLTEQMKDKLKVGNRPYMVVEGIIDGEISLGKSLREDMPEETAKKRTIVYTGKTNEKFGIKNLVDAFGLIESDEYRLIICGNGDSDAYIAEKAKQDHRIVATGQVTHDVAAKYISEATVLVNPRQNDCEYTKYSFPSKNIEYLSSGVPTVAYMLDGIPRVYRDFMYVPEDNSIPALAACILAAAQTPRQEHNKRVFEMAEYFKKLTALNVVKALIKKNFEKNQ